MPELSPTRATAVHSGRVLVVGDEATVRNTCVGILGDAGFTVEAVDDGLLVAVALDHLHFDVVITDVSLPSSDGSGVLNVVRTKDPDLPVILMMGGDDFRGAAQAFEHGAFLHVSKPVNEAALLNVTRDAVSLRRLSRACRRAIVRAATVASEER